MCPAAQAVDFDAAPAASVHATIKNRIAATGGKAKLGIILAWARTNGNVRCCCGDHGGVCVTGHQGESAASHEHFKRLVHVSHSF
ncbi:hypothetical protein D3C80_1885690 [compost metagenome]